MPYKDPLPPEVKLGRLTACIAAIPTEPGRCTEFPPCGKCVERMFESARMLVEGRSRYHNNPSLLLKALLTAVYNGLSEDDDVLVAAERLLNAELAEMNKHLN